MTKGAEVSRDANISSGGREHAAMSGRNNRSRPSNKSASWERAVEKSHAWV